MVDNLNCSFCGQRLERDGVSMRQFKCVNPRCIVGTAYFLNNKIEVVLKKSGYKVTMQQIGSKLVVTGENGEKIVEDDLRG